MMDSQNEQVTNQTFFMHGVRVVKLPDWLDWAIGKETTKDHWTVVLPMIQRGSVWKPHQVIDLWDTLLRGMPFGGLMASHIPASVKGSKVKFFRPLDRELVTLPARGGLSLIDGQQRTLAMLLAWPDVGEKMNRRVWVDFGESDKFDHLLRFHITTESHPLGYQRGGNSGESIARLTLSERRRAAATYCDRMETVSAVEPAASIKLRFLHDQEITPWYSTLPLDLRKLIRHHRDDGEAALGDYVQQEVDATKVRLKKRIQRIADRASPFSNFDDTLREGIINHLTRRLDAVTKITKLDLDHRIGVLVKGLNSLSQQYFPVIEVPSEMMSAEIDDDTKDPPLAVLFKRIGTGGTDLKTSDYVFSVIKHLNPECHSLVEKQLGKAQISAIFTPTSLVMSAVRLTAARLGMPDYSKLEKPQFTRLLRGDGKTKSGETSLPTFLPEFNRQIAQDGDFVNDLTAVLNAIAYRPEKKAECSDAVTLDIGLPKHALSLVQIPVLEVIQYWLQKCADSRVIAIQTNRHQIIRFILYWHLSVIDSAKASTECFKTLKAGAFGEFLDFPERKLIEMLVNQQLALPTCSPYELDQIEHLTHSPDNVAGLRGWRRFVVTTEGLSDANRDHLQKAAQLYKRWWNLRSGYSHLLLLWLQRDYVFRRFEETPAQPGLDDDTPYDFDHICPQSHWNYWTGKTAGNRLMDFPAQPNADNQSHVLLGNAIGNVRVWDSSENRGDGDATPSVKLKLVQKLQIPATDNDSTEIRLHESAIADGTYPGLKDETSAWAGCDCDSSTPNDPMYWTIGRARNFQKAIETRTFNLYQRFYLDLRFSEWQISGSE